MIRHDPRSPGSERFAHRGRRAARRALLVLIGLYVIVVALKTIGRGAGGMHHWFEALAIEGRGAALGLGWIMACAVMSGSPAAIIALTLLERGLLDRFETLAMVAGSRLGSCFIVLFVGVAHDLRSRERARGAYIGVAGVLVTASVILPALVLGELLLAHEGYVAALRFAGGGGKLALLDAALAPALALLDAIPWPPLTFGIGIALLLIAFKVFDLALPDVSTLRGRFNQVGSALYRPSIMFLVGFVVTLLTLSVSVSLTVLVPLTAKGYIRRENLLPYMLGANISTFVDTMAVSLLVDAPEAFPVVLTLMLLVAAFALPLVFFCFVPFEKGVDRVARWFTSGVAPMIVFLVLLLATPILLLLWW